MSHFLFSISLMMSSLKREFRQRERVLGHEVATTARGEVVAQAVGESLDVRPQRLDRPGCERA